MKITTLTVSLCITISQSNEVSEENGHIEVDTEAKEE